MNQQVMGRAATRSAGLGTFWPIRIPMSFDRCNPNSCHNGIAAAGPRCLS